MNTLKITIIYFVIGIFWLFYIPDSIFSAFPELAQLNINKSVVFLFLSTLALFFILKKNTALFTTPLNDESFFLRNSPTATLICTSKGDILKTNNAFNQLLNNNLPALKSINLKHFFPSLLTEDISALLSTHSLKNNKQPIKLLLSDNNNNELEVQITTEQIQLNNQPHFVIYITKIPPSKSALDEIINNEILFSSIFESLPVGVEIINISTGKRIAINQYLCNLLCCKKEDHLNENFITNNTWHDPEERSLLTERLKNEGKLTNYYTKIIDKKGKLLNVKINAIVISSINKDIALISILDKTNDTKLIKTINQVTQTIISKDTPSFFDDIVIQVSSLFDCDHCFIALLDKDNIGKMKTMSYSQHGIIADDLTYDIEGTPCKQVTKSTFSYYPNNVQKLFPKDIWFQENEIQSYIGIPLKDIKNKTVGAFILLFERATNFNNHEINFIKIFGSKIASELMHDHLITQLKLSQQHLNLYREQAPLASMEWDAEFNLISCNKAAEKMLGYSKEELQQKDFLTEMVPKADQKKVLSVCNKLISDAGGEFCINLLLSKKNDLILTEWHNATIKDNQNKIIGIISIVKNITEENAQLNLITNKEKTNREILNTIIDAVITIDANGLILTVNNATLTMFGYEESELIGKNVKLLMPHSISVHHDQYINTYKETKQKKIIGTGREVIARRKNKQEFPIRLTLAELPLDEYGNPRFVGTCHELTKMIEQQKTLARVQKMDALGKLTGGISHDFNNILGVILGFSELLELSLAEQPKLAGYCAQIIMASERGSNLTRKLLSFSKQQTHKLEAVNVNELLHDMENMITKALTASIHVQLSLADNLWLNKLDKNSFDDAILNLSINAKHAMPHGGNLTITTSNKYLSDKEVIQLNIPPGKYVCIAIEDNGCGMNSEVLSHLFEPFYTTKGEKGTGLGLPQVYGFVKSSYGGISTTSKVDIGTTIKLYLPQYRGIPHTVDSDNDSIVKSYAGSETILIVDDEPALTLLAQTILSDEGYNVYQANSALDALFYINEHRIDLLISDIIMPKTNGYQLVEKIRALGKNLPVLFASGFEGENKIINQNMKNIPLIHKPYNAKTLLAHVRKILDENLPIKASHQEANTKVKTESSIDDNTNKNEQKYNTINNLFKRHNKQLKELFDQFSKAEKDTEQEKNIELLQQGLLAALDKHFEYENEIMIATQYMYQKNHNLVHKLLLKQFNQAIVTKSNIEFIHWINSTFSIDFQHHSIHMDEAFDTFIKDKNIKASDLPMDLQHDN